MFNFEPPATEDEISASALQCVRKISGFTKPSQVNQAAFDQAIDDVTDTARKLLASLVTMEEPKDREVDAEKARARRAKRFGPSTALG